VRVPPAEGSSHCCSHIQRRGGRPNRRKPGRKSPRRLGNRSDGALSAPMQPRCSCVFLPFTSIWVAGNVAMNFRFSLVAVTVLVVTGCASDPAEQISVDSITSPAASSVVETPPPPTVVDVDKSSPPPKIARAPGPKTPSKCKGLPQLACTNVEGCEWVRPASSTDRDGRLLTDYCGLKAATASANQ